MRIIQTMLITFLFLTGFSQHLYKEKFPSCYINGFCLDCGTVKSDYDGRLDSFIVNNLSPKSINNLSGLIEVQILVDSTGHCCLMSMKNESNFESKKLKLEQLFESMNNWKPALKNTTPINASLCFQLNFEKGKLHLKRRSFDQKNTTNSKSVGTPNFKGSPRNELSYGWDVFIKDVYKRQVYNLSLARMRRMSLCIKLASVFLNLFN